MLTLVAACILFVLFYLWGMIWYCNKVWPWIPRGEEDNGQWQEWQNTNKSWGTQWPK